MRFRTGLIVGLAVGYYYGTKAGRERFEQIERVLEPVRESAPYQQVRTRLRGVVGASVRETTSRAKEAAFGPGKGSVLDLGSRADSSRAG